MSPEANPIAHFFAVLERYAWQPARPALRGSRETWSYARLLQESLARAAWLREREVQRLVLDLPNGPELLGWDLAALRAGIPCVLLPDFFSAEQRAHVLRDSGADFLLGRAERSAEWRAAGFTEADGAWRRPSVERTALPAHTAKLTYTSGTTGTPKGVCLRAAALLRVAASLESASRPLAPQRHQVLLSLGILLENLGVYAALLAGAEVLVLDGADQGISGSVGIDWARLAGCLQQRQPHSLILMPQLLQGLVELAERGLLRLDELSFAAVGGAPLSEALQMRAAALDLPIFQGYGLSECASVVALNHPGATRLGSVGQPLPHVHLRLAADGEVLVGGADFAGYLGQPDSATDEIATGDLGYFDADGYLYLRGRKKHQFSLASGRNVDPGWIEAELTQGGPIAQAYVQGEGARHLAALLWPRQAGTSDAELAAFVAQLNQHLPDYARIGAWQRLTEPFTPANGLLTATGRLRRDAIQAQYAALLSDLLEVHP
ncbi:AMP-binding protein [uncultured Pseudomonas sp.]|uniref:AMP-binding protein n=1 Tax=uncultured Pseudomonas sp. TaxID=114707 RepID=UPI0025EAA81F|nr:AMP-binding protein [uncultured Pseudomonas sp.]